MYTRIPMRNSFAIILCACIATTSAGQEVYGVVSDGKTNEPLPYVHIGVAGKNFGVISRDDGSFKLDLSKADREDRLVFSIIGYESRSFTVGEVRGRMDVRLAPKVYELRDVVVVRDTRARPAIKLGRYTPTKTTDGQSGKEEFGFGGEIGLKISPAGKKYYVNDARFHMRGNTVDSILFRINLYKVENSMPGESVLQREVFTTARKKMKWIVAGLKSENIVMDQDLIVTYEVVRIWISKRGDNRMFFSYGEGYEEGKIYYRPSSHAAWTLDAPRGPAAFYLTVEEY
jgi:hypothetical protein